MSISSSASANRKYQKRKYARDKHESQTPACDRAKAREKKAAQRRRQKASATPFSYMYVIPL